MKNSIGSLPGFGGGLRVATTTGRKSVQTSFHTEAFVPMKTRRQRSEYRRRMRRSRQRFDASTNSRWDFLVVAGLPTVAMLMGFLIRH